MIALVLTGLVLVGLQIFIFWIENRRLKVTSGPKTLYIL
jgi:uncharacterized membrane protein YqjE